MRTEPVPESTTTSSIASSPEMNAATTSPQRSLQIGPVRLAHPFVQAALSGYSDWPMRTLARRCGASYTLAEVMIDRFAAEVKSSKKTRQYLAVSDDEHPVGGQLMGSDPDQFRIAAQRLVDAGFDVIDINFGCPVKSAMSGRRGGYHLGAPETALEIVRTVRDVVPAEIPVTVKMRRGIDDSAESEAQFYEIFDGAFAAGVAAVTVHGRTVEQRYIGPSNWDFLRRLKAHAGSRVVLGSGDLFSAEDCVAMLRQTGVDGVTIARGAIGNPWIFRQALALWKGEPMPPFPTVFEQRSVLEEHLRLAFQFYGERKAVSQIRKFGCKYSRLHPEESSVVRAFGQSRTREEWLGVLKTWYSVDAPGKAPHVDEVSCSTENQAAC